MNILKLNFIAGYPLKESLYHENTAHISYTWRNFPQDHVSIVNSVVNDLLSEGINLDQYKVEIEEMTLFGCTVDPMDKTPDYRKVLRVYATRAVQQGENTESRYSVLYCFKTDSKYKALSSRVMRSIQGFNLESRQAPESDVKYIVEDFVRVD